MIDGIQGSSQKNLSFMKRLLLILFFTASLYFVQAQCLNNFITPSFDSKCILTQYSDRIPRAIISETDCNQVCKMSSVTYSIAVPTGSSVNWTVVGANSFTGQGTNTISVQWGNSDEGSVSVTITKPDGSVYTETICVVLIEPPTISSVSIPPAPVLEPITICLGASVVFINTTTVNSGESPIVGHFWRVTRPGNPVVVSSSEHYTFTPTIIGLYTITHTVVNACGCESSEQYQVNVRPGIRLEISCYGTVCAGSTHTYDILNPTLCSSYTWTVTDGTIINTSPNGTSATIQWNNPSQGFGTITITGNGCPQTSCSTHTIKIPIISNPAEIFGPDTVCVGETQIYNTTLWGSTQYSWNVNGYPPYHGYNETQNSILHTFHTQGSYTISVEYENSFLNCGGSATKTIQVLPRLEIESETSTICKGDSATFTVNLTHAQGANSTIWRIYDSANNQVYPNPPNPPPPPSDKLEYHFTTAGTYRVSATNANACNTANYIITVSTPPQPYAVTISGPQSVCYGTSATYSATPPPTNPNHVLLWQLASPCSSEVYSGNSVSITFGNTICDILVYQQDMVTGCISDTPLIVYPVSPFVLADIDTTAQTVCAGSTIPLSVPDQRPTVMYKWYIYPTNAASVEGNNLLPDVTIVANQINNNTVINVAYAVVERTSCGGYLTMDTIKLNLVSTITPTITAPDVCKNAPATITAVGVPPFGGSYSWQFNNGNPPTSTTNPAYPSFSVAGQQNISLTYTLNGCEAHASGTIFVHDLPAATVTPDTSNLPVIMTVAQTVNASFQWSFNGVNISGGNASIQSTASYGYGTYCCTVTDLITNCTNSGCYEYKQTGGNTCINIPLTFTAIPNSCNQYEVTAHTTVSPLSWNTTAGTINVTSNTTAIVTFKTVGYPSVHVSGSDGSNCYAGTIAIPVNYVLGLDYEFHCPDTLVIHDVSSYSGTYTIPPRPVTITINGSPTTITLLSTTRDAFFIVPPITTQTQCTISMTIGNCTVTKEFTLYPLPSNLSMTIENISCENTPILFTASADNATAFKWDFGDNSSSNNNPVYHTYDHTQLPYPITLTAYNTNGCSKTISQTKIIDPKNIIGSLDADGSQVCVGQPREIYWTIPDDIISYDWSTPPTPTTINTHDIYQSGDHWVVVTSDIGCKDEKSVNVPFYNLPTARIIGASCYCKGDSIKLSAYTAQGETLKYEWTYPVAGGTATDTTQNISIPADIAGQKTITLMVENIHGCLAYDTITVEVLAKPDPPLIDFLGNHCIHNPPVCITSTDNRELHWSNGEFGRTACFYNPGIISAYYSENGCNSDDKTLMICPAPNFDALLTGCYCLDTLPAQLPVYRLLPNSICYSSYPPPPTYPTFNWNNSGISPTSGNLYPITTFTINDFGSYNMTVNYTPNYNCSLTSPTLRIDECKQEPPPVPCDTATIENCYVNCCQMYFDKMQRVCNRSNKTMTYTYLTASQGFTVVGWLPNPLILAPGQCANVFITVRVDDFSQTTGKFTLLASEANNHCNNSNPCNVTFGLSIDKENCIREDCQLVEQGINYIPGSSIPYQTSNFDFRVRLPLGTTSLLSFWTDPPVLQNYNNLPPAIVIGTLSFDYNMLLEMDAMRQDVCFYAIVCIENKYLCKAKLCIPARRLLNMLPY